MEPERRAVLELIRSEGDKIRALRGMYELTLRRGIERQKFRQIIVFHRPDRFRSELLATNFNQPTNIVVTQGSFLQGIDFQEKRFLEGSPSLKNVKQLLSVPFFPEELMLWLSGTFGVVPGADFIGQNLFLERGSERFLIEFLYRDNRAVQLRGSVRLKDRFVRCDALEILDQKSRNRVFTSEFAYEGELKIPSTITFWLQESELQGELSVSEVKPNPGEIPERLFSLVQPNGFRSIELGD